MHTHIKQLMNLLCVSTIIPSVCTILSIRDTMYYKNLIDQKCLMNEYYVLFYTKCEKIITFVYMRFAQSLDARSATVIVPMKPP